MARLGSYPRAAALDGSEIAVIEQQGVTRTLPIAAFPAPVQTFDPTGYFYTDQGAKLPRYGDRLFVGAATDNQGQSNRDAGPTDWLSTLMASTSIGAWAVWGSTTASLARFGTIGLLGASRTSDATKSATQLGYTPSTIGIASWGIADDTANPTTATAYAYYGECWRMTGVDYQPTFVMELEAVNLGGVASGLSTPYHPNCGGGTYGVQIGAGGGQTSGTSDAEAAITVVNNPASFKAGLIFGAGALSGTDGTDSGYGTAIAMARNHGIQWQTPETVDNVPGANTGAMILSTVETAANGSRIQFLDSVLAFENATGHSVFTISIPSDPDNTLQIQAGAGTQAAGVYVQSGTDGSPNLGLYPATGGELQISSPTVAGGSKLSENDVPVQWLHINVNGQDLRIPLFTPAQAGG